MDLGIVTKTVDGAKRYGPALAVSLLIFGVGYLIGDGRGIGVQSPLTVGGDAVADPATESTPFEFLYIDVDRVGAYLAQLKGGTYVKQNLSEKVVRTKSGEIVIKGALKAGASTQSESFVQREVTPTAASSFVELRSELDAKDALEDGFMRRFDERVAPPNRDGEPVDALEEGDFVSFETKVRPPIYLNPYLAVHYGATLAALFPNSDDPARNAFAESQRRASRGFRRKVGLDPRIVIAIDRTQVDGERRVKYLLPMHVKQLNEERSLLRSGGGTFTVVGKVVRIFANETATPGRGEDGDSYNYVDAPTREIWQQPLKAAPPELICRAYVNCANALHGFDSAQGGQRRDLIEKTRQEMLSALTAQTRIEDVGAVILPIAIYK